MATNSSPSRTLLIAGIGFALACMVILNMFIQRMDPKYQEEMQRERERNAAAEQAKKQAQAPPPTASANSNKLVTLGESVVLGTKDSKSEVVIGWSWTPEVQADPGNIYGAVEKLQKLVPGMRIRVINADANPTVQQGLSFNGNLLIPIRPDGALILEEHSLGPLMAAASRQGLTAGGPPPGGGPPGGPPPGPKP